MKRAMQEQQLQQSSQQEGSVKIKPKKEVDTSLEALLSAEQQLQQSSQQEGSVKIKPKKEVDTSLDALPSAGLSVVPVGKKKSGGK